MRKLDEKREVLYVIRAMDVLMSSGIGLEATVHSISQGGYGIISEDFSNMMDKVRKGGRPLAKEIKWSIYEGNITLDEQDWFLLYKDLRKLEYLH